MTPCRLTSRRLMMSLLAASLLFTLLGIRTLQSRSDETNSLVFKFEERAYFSDGIPGNVPVMIKSPSDYDQLRASVPAPPGPSRKLIYETARDNTSPNTESIPRIIHQTWSVYNIPTSMVNWVKSFTQFNPEFEYWFWTDEDALDLVKTKYPEYLEYYTKYPKAIQRADAMRYFVLHQFGGFYADMDISSLKSLEPLRRHSCIVSQEPWVHAKVYWGLKKLLPCNAFLAAAPKHPFMKLLIETIPANFHGNNIDDVMDKTGPMMVNRMLEKYANAKAGNFTDVDRLYLAEPNLFHPRYDPNLRNRYIQGCDRNNAVKYSLSASEIRECDEARKRGFRFKMPAEAYTDHHWMHYWIGGTFVKKINPSQFIHIKDVVSKVKNVSEILRHLKLTAPSS